MSALTLRQLVNQRLREWRRDGRTLQTAADALNSALGYGQGHARFWSRQAVAKAESGQRAWSVEDLVGLARATGLSVADLLASTEDVLVGEWVASPADLRQVIGVGRSSPGDVMFDDLVRLRHLTDQMERAYVERLADLRREVAADPQLEATIRGRVQAITDREVEDLEAMVAEDAEHAALLAVERGEPAPEPADPRREVGSYLATSPAWRTGVEALQGRPKPTTTTSRKKPRR